MNIRATIPAAALLDWEGQVCQYDAVGMPGITWERNHVPEYPDTPIDCLLYRAEPNEIVGILNYYAYDFPPFELAGNCNIWVHPRMQRQGIGTILLDNARSRGWAIDPEQQRYTEAGAAFARRYYEVEP